MKASVSRRKSGATARFSSSSVNAMLLLVIVGFLRLVIVSQLQLYRRPTVASPTCLIYTTSWDITFAVDGALFRTPDTPELREHFGSGNTSTVRQTPFPMARLVALMNVRSHLIVDAQISPYRRGEIPLAADFLEQIPSHSITLF